VASSSRASEDIRFGVRPRQLALEFTPAPGFDLSDFFVSSSNEQAYGMVEAWPAWPDPVFFLIGSAGAGKSHLGAIWANKAVARAISAASLEAADLEALAKGPLLVEDLDGVGPAETKLFHLLNLVRERGLWLLLTARVPPEALGLTIADLVSRLRLAPRAEIFAPDEALMRTVLVKLVVDRQLVVDTGLVEYAALRLGRSFDIARIFVEEIDRRAMSRKSRITRRLAAEVIRDLTGREQADDEMPRSPENTSSARLITGRHSE
jgi:chromosomal replication initiation ATPase DnaA